MKKFINLSIAVYLLVGILLLVIPSETFPGFYNPSLMATLAIVSAIFMISPRIIFRKPGGRQREHALLKLQFIITFALIINGLGGLGLYKLYQYDIPYDKFTHLVTSFIFVIGLSYFIRVWFGKNIITSISISSILVLFGAITWEFLEALSDRVVGTNLLGGGTGGIFWDTFWDSVMNLLGISLGIFVAKRDYKKESTGDLP